MTEGNNLRQGKKEEKKSLEEVLMDSWGDQ